MAFDVTNLRPGDRIDTGSIQRRVRDVYPDGSCYIVYGDGSQGMRTADFMRSLAMSGASVTKPHPLSVQVPDGI